MHILPNDEHDHETPHCPVCGDNVGMHNDAVLMLRGQFFYNRQDGYAMFVLDPDARITVLELPNALGSGASQFAFVIDPVPEGPVLVSHEGCLEDEMRFVSDEDDEDEEDEEDLDEEMEAAMARDSDWDGRNWDDNDGRMR